MCKWKLNAGNGRPFLLVWWSCISASRQCRIHHGALWLASTQLKDGDRLGSCITFSYQGQKRTPILPFLELTMGGRGGGWVQIRRYLSMGPRAKMVQPNWFWKPQNTILEIQVAPHPASLQIKDIMCKWKLNAGNGRPFLLVRWSCISASPVNAAFLMGTMTSIHTIEGWGQTWFLHHFFIPRAETHANPN